MGMLVDVLGIGLVLGLAWMGRRRGAWEAGLRLVALFAAYGAAVVAARRLGDPVARELAVAPFLGMAVVGTAGFLLTALVTGAVARAVGRAERGQYRDERPAPGSRRLGGALGALRGAILLVPLLWLAHLMQGAGAAGVAPALPDLADARLPRLGGAAARRGADWVLDPSDPAERVAARLLTEPGTAVVDAQAALAQPSLVALRDDTAFWEAIEDGETERALERQTFTAVLHDADLRRRLAELGVVDPRAGEDPQVFRAEMETALTQVGERLRRLRRDPAFLALMRDEELGRRLQEGDTLALLAHPSFHVLMGRLGEGPQGPSQARAGG